MGKPSGTKVFYAVATFTASVFLVAYILAVAALIGVILSWMVP